PSVHTSELVRADRRRLEIGRELAFDRVHLRFGRDVLDHHTSRITQRGFDGISRGFGAQSRYSHAATVTFASCRPSLAFPMPLRPRSRSSGSTACFSTPVSPNHSCAMC